ncbi:MAG: putative metal-binding motif-containing protein [Myxococcota bacterium]|nr:putative metal-binding motif-containing protein [Myxococcota bacterium]
MRHILIPCFLLLSCRDSAKIDLTEEEIEVSDLDSDGDGYLVSDDCNDNNAAINPSAVEICDGVDNNCSGEIDEGVSTPFYADSDGDGFGDPNTIQEACEPPSGYLTAGNDCDDNSDAVFPGAPEDCNQIDDDCDGEIDEDLISGLFFDADGDGHGDPNLPSDDCNGGEGYVLFGDDCNDNDPAIVPFTAELCDGIDNDCDDEIDEGVTTTYYLDSDNDLFGNPNTPLHACEQPVGYIEDNRDCDDADPMIHPDALEYCNGSDDNCDGQIDNSPTEATIWFNDIDGDGYGSDFITAMECEMPPGYVANNTDCDDTRISVYPGATEECNQMDDDCNGQIDDNASDAFYWFADYDHDGFGDPNVSLYQCDQPFDFISDSSDCDDDNDEVNPAADEVCNAIDDDCDGNIDINATDANTYFLDDDEDGFGDANMMAISCSAPTGYVEDDTDCDDNDDTVYPDAKEYCDGIDQNCNGNNFYELDLDNNNLLACEESLWMRNSSTNSTSPNGACSQAASYLSGYNVTIHDEYHGNHTVTSSLLENFGLYVHHGNNMNGALGAYTNAEATAIADWVYNGGRMLLIGFHSTQDACEASNSIPYQFGVSCDSTYHSWSGTTSSFISHPITNGLSLVGGLGGENWVVQSPAQVLASVNGYEFIVVVEHGAGKVVLIADEWPYYNPRGGHSISFGDNRQMVQNIWEWLLD